MRFPVLRLTLALAAISALPAFGATARLGIQLGHTLDNPGAFEHSAVMTPDGKYVLTSGPDGVIIYWDVVSGREVKRLTGVATGNPMWLSPTGRWLATTVVGGVQLRDVATGSVARSCRGLGTVDTGVFSPTERYLLAAGAPTQLFDRASCTSIWKDSDLSNPYKADATSFTPDSRLIVVYSDAAVRVLETATGRELQRLPVAKTLAVAISPDGKLVQTAGADGIARVWDRATGREIRRWTFAPPTEELYRTAAFSADGKRALSGEKDGTAHLWDTETGTEIYNLPWPRDDYPTNKEVRFSPDQRYGLLVKARSTTLWDLTTGRVFRNFEGNAAGIKTVGFTGDGQTLFAAGWLGKVHLWNLAAGRQDKNLDPDIGVIMTSSVTRDGSYALLSGEGGPGGFEAKGIRLGPPNGTQEMQFTASVVQAISPDGKTTAVHGILDPSKTTLWNSWTGEKLGDIPAGYLKSLAFSADGSLLAATDEGGDTVVWDVKTRTQKATHPGPLLAFAPLGNRLTLSGGASIKLIDPVAGTVYREIPGVSARTMAWAPGGQSILVGTTSDAVQWVDITAGKVLWTWEGAQAELTAVAISRDGKLAAAAFEDGGVRLLDARTGKLLVTLFTFRDGDWAVVDPDGRYDASNPEESDSLYWLLGDDVVELKQLKSRFYTPNLLSRVLGLNPEPLSKVSGLSTLALAPVVDVQGPRAGNRTATLRLTDRGGGIGRVVVKVNGRELPSATRGAPIQSGVPVSIDLSGAELRADGNNKLEIVAYDSGNFVAGREMLTTWVEAPERSTVPPVLHAIVVGVSVYENPAMSLRFPAKDALDMAHALDVGGKRMFGVDKVDIQVFATGTGNAAKEPNKENLRKAFAAIPAKSNPNDVVLVFLAGHGVAGEAGSDLYYYLTREARNGNPNEDPTLWKQTTVSSAELLEWLRAKGMPLRQVVVLDTCAAGNASGELMKLADRRELNADQRRALELLKDATGSHILMGSAADKVSYEASQYGQGLLTYSLLLGMRGEDLDEGGRLDVSNWFRKAQQRVPEFAKGIGGIQQPVISSPQGQSFPIAMFTAADRGQINLPSLKPRLLRAIVQDADQGDPLGLGEPVRTALRAVSIPVARGEVRAEPPLVYLDQVAGDVTNALIPLVRYEPVGNGLKIRLRLVSSATSKLRGEANITTVNSDPAETAKKVTAEFVKMLPGLAKE